MTLDRIPDDKGEKRGAVIDMTWHRKKREAQRARAVQGNAGGVAKGAQPWKIRLAFVFQALAVVFGIAVLFRGCGWF